MKLAFDTAKATSKVVVGKAKVMSNGVVDTAKVKVK